MQHKNKHYNYNEHKEKINHSYEISEEDYSLWLQAVKDKLSILDKAPWNLSIFTVPSRLRKLDKDPYTPRTVSIGPLHHRKHDQFVVTEEHKWTYMLYLIGRASVPFTVIEQSAKAIKDMETTARRAYAESFKLEKHEMMEILLLDGCFMLEIFIRYSEASQHDNHQADDPILENKWLVQDLQQDFALLENQIPFAVLVSLFGMIQKFMNVKLPYSLHRYALKFFQSALKISDKAIEEKARFLTDKDVKHMVHMLHCAYFSTIPRRFEETALQVSLELHKGRDKVNKQGFEQSATELHHAGIQIVKGDGDKLLLITFENGILTIPCLSINRRTDPMLRNLIAFEQCSSRSTNHMLSYATLMRSLINSSHDVELLKQKGVIKQASCGAKDIIGLFEGFCQGVDLEEFDFAPLCDQVNEYMKMRPFSRRITAWLKNLWYRSMVAFKDEICATTWTILSVAAAIILLTFTALQTIYSAVAYYHHNS